jgi:hypothetical protein
MSIKSSHLLMRIRIALGKFLRLFWRPLIPKLKNGEIRLHLGCGKINHPGFVNIDAIPRRHVHYVQPGTKLRNFKNDAVDFSLNLEKFNRCRNTFSTCYFPRPT